MQKYSIFFVLLVMIIASTMMNPNFLSQQNVTNIAVQLAVATILAYGEMVLIVSCPLVRFWHWQVYFP